MESDGHTEGLTRPWPEESRGARGYRCRVFLWRHGFLTKIENTRLKQRFARTGEDFTGESLADDPSLGMVSRDLFDEEHAGRVMAEARVEALQQEVEDLGGSLKETAELLTQVQKDREANR